MFDTAVRVTGLTDEWQPVEPTKEERNDPELRLLMEMKESGLGPIGIRLLLVRPS